MSTTRVSSVFDDRTGGLRLKLAGIFALIAVGNVAAWAWAVIAFHGSTLLFSAACLAYGLGLRHAFDADHIAAIDNVTRKLMQEGKRPISAGFFFSLGHSTVVVVLAALIGCTAAALADRFLAFKDIGSAIGAGASALFLFAIAAANLLIFAQVARAFQSVRRGGLLVEKDLDRILLQRGLLGCIFRRLYRLIGRSWHMYPLGVLFGLGFDTATEVSLLGLTALQASHGLSIWTILMFPALFAAGMLLIDTIDGVVMMGAYGWSFVKPIRKLYYNLAITFASVVVAFAIGGVEIVSLIGDQFSLSGPFWNALVSVNDNLGGLGFAIAMFFVLAWLVSFLIHRAKRHGSLGAAS